MVDIRQIGQLIAEKRKEKKISQSELAERLHISYQAVSNWERGVSAPDITKLPELADILDTSVDALLGASAESERGDIRGNQCQSIAAFTFEEFNEQKPDEKEIRMQIPYMESAERVKFVESFIEENNTDLLFEAFPFLSSKDARRIAVRLYKKGGFEAMKDIIHFLDGNFVKVLVFMEMKKGNRVEVPESF